MCAPLLIADNLPPAPRLFTVRGSLLTSSIQPLTSAFPCAPLTHARAFDSCFSHQSPACSEHQRRVTNHQALTPLECTVEHPMKDTSPEGVSRPKDLKRSRKSIRMRSSAILRANSFRMRSYKNAPP